MEEKTQKFACARISGVLLQSQMPIKLLVRFKLDRRKQALFRELYKLGWMAFQILFPLIAGKNFLIGGGLKSV